MLCQVRIRLKTPVVGDTYDDGRRMFMFPRDDGAWKLDRQAKHVWNGLLENAVESLRLNIDTTSVRWPTALLLPTLHLLNMPGKHLPGRKAKGVDHEMIPRNVVLTIPVMLRLTDGETMLNAPSLEQLREIFAFIGEYEGISPFGSEVGFGLFSVLSVTTAGDSPFGVEL